MACWAFALRHLGEDLCAENGGPYGVRAADQEADGNFA